MVRRLCDPGHLLEICGPFLTDGGLELQGERLDGIPGESGGLLEEAGVEGNASGDEQFGFGAVFVADLVVWSIELFWRVEIMILRRKCRSIVFATFCVERMVVRANLSGES